MTSGPFGLNDTQQLHGLIAAAGFNQITIHPAAKVLRFPSPKEFVLRYVAGSALSGPLSAASEAGRAALLAEAQAALRSYVDDQGLVFPIESNFALARK
jgi:hypothetical protein